MTPDLHEIHECEICGNCLIPVLDLGDHPMCDDLVPLGESRVCREYPIEILYCTECCTAHQRFQIPKLELFPATYHYRSRFTADVLNGMAELVAECEQRFGALRGKRVLDVGCNDGSLLDAFGLKGAITIGVEPTEAYLDAVPKGHKVFNDFLSTELAESIVASGGQPDFIVFTNVFAHIENLRNVISSLKLLMAKDTVLVIENHYLGAVLDKKQFDTFYHEHPRTYSATSFVHIASLLSAKVLAVEFPARYGGNIRVFIGGTASGGAIGSMDVIGSEQQFPLKFNELRETMECWRQTKMALLEQYVKRLGRLKAKAFPGRAAILAKLLRLDEHSISAVYEKPGSLKIGHYVPGTRIPICSDDELFALSDKTKPLLNLAWHISDEIRAYVREHAYTGEVIDILSSADFGQGR